MYALEVDSNSFYLHLSIFLQHDKKKKKGEKTFAKRILSKNKMSDKLNYIKIPLPHLHFLFKRDASGKDGFPVCLFVAFKQLN